MMTSKLGLKHKVLAINIIIENVKMLKITLKQFMMLQEQVGFLDPIHANETDLIFAAYENEIKNVFVPCDKLKSNQLKWNWHCVNPSEPPEEELRYEFTAEKCKNKSILDLYWKKSFPKDTSWLNPIHYFYDVKSQKTGKKIIAKMILLLVFSLLPISTIAQDLKATQCNTFIHSNCRAGKWGYLDLNGKTVIPFKYDDAVDFYNGATITAVLYNNWWGFINKKGKEVIPFQYSTVRYVGGELVGVLGTSPKGSQAANYGTGSWGLVNLKTGKVVLAPKYFSISEFTKEGLSVVQTFQGARNFNKYGFIDVTGKEVIPAIYDNAFDFYNGQAKVSLGKEDFYIDKQGNRIGGESNSQSNANSYQKYVEETQAAVGLKSFAEGNSIHDYKVGFKDIKTGNIVIDAKYAHAMDFEGGFESSIVGYGMVPWASAVKLYDKYGFINTKGETIVPIIYDNAIVVSGGLSVTLCGRDFFVDRNGNEVETADERDNNGRIIQMNAKVVKPDPTIAASFDNFWVEFQKAIAAEDQAKIIEMCDFPLKDYTLNSNIDYGTISKDKFINNGDISVLSQFVSHLNKNNQYKHHNKDEYVNSMIFFLKNGDCFNKEKNVYYLYIDAFDDTTCWYYFGLRNGKYKLIGCQPYKEEEGS